MRFPQYSTVSQSLPRLTFTGRNLCAQTEGAVCWVLGAGCWVLGAGADAGAGDGDGNGDGDGSRGQERAEDGCARGCGDGVWILEMDALYR